MSARCWRKGFLISGIIGDRDQLAEPLAKLRQKQFSAVQDLYSQLLKANWELYPAGVAKHVSTTHKHHKRKELIALPPWSVQRQYAFGILLGRMSRWREMGLEPTEMSEALICLFLDFYKHGWSKKSLRKAVYRAAQRCSNSDKSLIIRIYHLSFCMISH